jgi:hypothetical protein
VAPAGTRICCGRLATLALLDMNSSCAPPSGAGAGRFTVSVAVLLPSTLEEIDSEAIGAHTVRYAYLPATVILTKEFVAGANVEMANVALAEPAGTVMDAGVIAIPELLLETLRTKPWAGAGPVSVTMAIEEDPPASELGLRVTDCTEGAATDMEAFRVVPPYVPEMMTELFVATACVDIVKPALVSPGDI